MQDPDHPLRQDVGGGGGREVTKSDGLLSLRELLCHTKAVFTRTPHSLKLSRVVSFSFPASLFSLQTQKESGETVQRS